MAQDSRTVNDIINNAFFLIGAITPDRIPTASDVNTGLYLLNDLLDSFSVIGVMIPTIKDIVVTLTPGKADYIVSNIVPADFNFNRIVELDFVRINEQSIIYPVRVVDRAVIQNAVRFEASQAMPDKVFLDKQELYSRLSFYPTPQLAYVTTISAKFMFNRLSLYQVINEVPPDYYKFLRYSLARELRSYYPSAQWDEVKENEYQMMLRHIQAGSEVNLLIDPDNILMTPFFRGYYYNFGII
jgi:hypothetical protein